MPWTEWVWYACHRTAGQGDASCQHCGHAVLAQPLPPRERILCDLCFDAWHAQEVSPWTGLTSSHWMRRR